MRINHNITAMNTYRQFNINSTNTSKSMEKLSSGYRINRAADDAAGLSISEKMRSQIRGLTQANRNTQDGISMIQTAEGALTEVSDMLTRMKELSVQVQNGTYSDDDAANIGAEMQSLGKAITDIYTNTKFNGKAVFGATATGGVDTAKTAADIKGTLVENVGEGMYFEYDGTNGWSTSADGTNVANATLAAAMGTATAADIGLVADTTYYVNDKGEILAGGPDGAQVSVKGYGQTATDVISTLASKADATNKLIMYNEETKTWQAQDDTTKVWSTVEGIAFKPDDVGLESGKIYYVDDSETTVADKVKEGSNSGTAVGAEVKAYSAGKDNDALKASDTDTDIAKIVYGEQGDQSVTIKAAATTELAKLTAATSAANMDADGAAAVTVELVENAITEVNATRATYGAQQNQLEHMYNNMSATKENLQSAESRVRDVDMAEEMMNYTKSNIVQQAAQAMLAQANSQPQGVLQLLQ